MHRYPNNQSVQDWLTRLEATQGDAAQLRRLLPLVASRVDAQDRLSLHRHLWRLWARLDERTRDEATRWLDGHFAAWCRHMEGDWAAPQTWLGLAEAHLVRSAVWPHAPDYVLALLRSHGQEGSRALPHARWLALQARFESDTEDIPEDEVEGLLAQIEVAVAAGVAPREQGMARMFELAVRTGNEVLATEALADCVKGGATLVLSPHWWRRWLEGDCPLVLTHSLQVQWFQPWRLNEPAWRARLLASMHRSSSRARVQALQVALGDGGSDPRLEWNGDASAKAWRTLDALENCYLMAEEGVLPEGPARMLVDSGALGSSTRAALCRLLALRALDRGDAASAARALAEARAAHGDGRARQWLAALLRLLCESDHAAVQSLCITLEVSSSSAAGDVELAQWRNLAAQTDIPASLRTLARAMLARACQDGMLEFGSTQWARDLPGAEALWRQLSADPAHADEARQRLDSEPLQYWLPLLVQRTAYGREHLWVVPPPERANGELLIVLSCLEGRHSYVQVRTLQRDLPGHHLMFVNNPEFNWYGDQVFDELDRLVQARVLPDFSPQQVTCYFGSMGGHGALKLANRFGFRAVVFNAQVDLDLWAAFRPNERQRLWAASTQAHAEVVAGAAPLYLAVGSDVADREALSVLIESLRVCRDGQFIIEKFADPHHAGLVRRIARHGIPAFIAQAAQRLAQLQAAHAAPAGMVAVAEAQQASFWAQLDAEPALKVEIVWRSGRLFIAESTRCDTVSS